MSELFESLASLVRKPTGYADEKPFQAEFFSVERLEQFAQTLAAKHKTVTRKGRAQLSAPARRQRPQTRSRVQSPRRSASPGPRNFTRRRMARRQLSHRRRTTARDSPGPCQRATTTNSQNSPKANSKAIRESTPSRSRSSRTPTRVSTQTPCKDLSPPIKLSRRSRSANSGRSPSPCVSRSSKTFAVSPSRSRVHAQNAKKPTNSPTNCSSWLHCSPSASCRFSTSDSAKREELPQTFLVQLVQRLREQHPSVMPVMDWIEKQLERRRHQHRTDHSRRTPTTGRGAGHCRKHHHQHASALDARLERLL